MSLATTLALKIDSSLSQTLKVHSKTLFVVEKGSSLSKVCRQLIRQNAVSNCFGHKLKARFDSQLSNIKSGTYALEPNMSLNDFLQNLVMAKEAQFAFTIVEGKNLYQVLASLQNQPHINNDIAQYQPEVNNRKQYFEDLAKRFQLPEPHLEGYLFPDTYFYVDGTKASELLARAINKQQSLLKQLLQQHDLPRVIKSEYELLIIASIIEKESSNLAEQNIIASVFYNRLAKRMRLQTDPTVIYGVWDEYKGDITRKHLSQKTAYNTYRINGLPPTPIANPGVAAITAALNPATTDYLYFVASGKGDHVFNKTLAGHNKSVREYLKLTKSKTKRSN